ncbi:MAG: Hydroxymethylglutaryl-CoA reductase [Candidatus Gottesmanbacteria bacterium GW2011_GWA2_44_17]|uniref:hydroxymethylglutaryl-CoA reductase (NADPH) n=3 Tax=Candidatus Gottesmaniibacteriota TaxID=1752720 RepID=A0A0G1IPE9_9BACT|nr:MAG: Hydroxymethylglutaryl-CoA reductase [Microgenomates group bacterium GW2011_GWC1_43_11]KKT38884.1 MAG: Hydroxymethylglutaryl-CoA reductase [Candidatus Gottesmanbacteria bacterium GW2011_GWB1_44_11c]KKT47453.1 MAG: Hydroxymethylglutaryl-CoA reductase [Candidatus Gottesmanbacteria bacterium GW2011_GWA2_44_17]KKT61246.1 MAG: Hydroxymethylglutaryl-CoA reductase [Candidatus Gottesmanbacteria bacterium GW2011_GWA1_44_24b]HCM82466.1 3-hydroxy-3-methylglutaryl-CoA reductase [Patescibacteria grou
MNLRNCKTIKDRRGLVEKELGVDLNHTGSYSLDEEIASTRNCENMIGVTQIPLGIAGPLRLTSFAQGKLSHTYDYYLPLATTEGALVASVNRGCKAITESGGADVVSQHIGTTRGSIYVAKDLHEILLFEKWITDHFEELQIVSASVSSHLTLLKADTEHIGTSIFVRWYFDTKDAMGMNMVTIAATALAKYIEGKMNVSCIAVAGNFDVDKKPSWLNSIKGRGRKVWAEVHIPEKVICMTLKTTAFSMYKVWLNKYMLGSAISGSMAFNAHFANILAALFIATGQDVAHISECSLGITTVKPEEKDLYVSVYLPDVMVGTVGGGTGLATQKEAFEILGVAGGNDGKNAERFAEIIGGAVLAGEISLLASLSEGTLARAHRKLGRGGR